MRKMIVEAVIACAFCATIVACNAAFAERHENMYPVEVERCLDVVYATSCDYLSVKYDYHATDEKKISVIRCADIADDAGDVLPEMWEYDEVANIVWPHGYGVE